MIPPLIRVLVAVACWSVSSSAWAHEARTLSEAVALLDSKEPLTRWEGFLRIEALRDPEAMDVVERAARSPEDATRAWGVRALLAIQGRRGIPRLVDVLSQDTSGDVRRAAVLALDPWVSEDDTIVSALIAAADDADAVVRLAVADVLGRVATPSVRDALIARWHEERHRDVRRVLSRALRHLAEP